jgi:hypothetical protein
MDNSRDVASTTPCSGDGALSVGVDGTGGEGTCLCWCIVSKLESECSESRESDGLVGGGTGGVSDDVEESRSGKGTFADLGDRLKIDLDMVVAFASRRIDRVNY